MRRHAEMLTADVFGNPHSVEPDLAAWPPSSWSGPASGCCASSTPRRTSTASSSPRTPSHALKLVGESYPFMPGGRFLLTFDNHNSVNGIREFARAHGAAIDLRAGGAAGHAGWTKRRSSRSSRRGSSGHPGLFAYPAQSNFSGVQHPLDVDRRAQDAGLGRPARRGRLRADQPARPVAAGIPTSSSCPSTRCSATRPASARSSRRRRARQAAPAVVRRRHDHRRVGRGRPLLPGGRGLRPSRTARSTSSACPPSGSASTSSSAWEWTPSTSACSASPAG